MIATNKDALQFYKNFGVQEIKQINSGKGQYVGTCPFCGKDRHFYFNDSGQYDCKKCHATGNAIKYLKIRHDKHGREINEILSIYGLNYTTYQKLFTSQTKTIGKSNKNIEEIYKNCLELIREKPEKLQELVQLRKYQNIAGAIRLMQKYKICCDHLENFIIPFFNFDGSIRGLERYNPKGVIKSIFSNKIERYMGKNGKPEKAMLMRGSNTGLFGYQEAYNNKEIKTIIVCESALKALHMQLQGFDGKNSIGVNNEKVLAVGVVGTGHLPKDQVEFFRGRDVEFCYDDDLSNDNPGQRGVLVDAKKIVGAAKSIFNINPESFPLSDKLKNKYNKIDIADDFWVEGGNLQEFLQSRDIHKKEIEFSQKVQIGKAENEGFNPIREAEIFKHGRHLIFLHEQLLMYQDGWYQPFCDRYYLNLLERQLENNFKGRRHLAKEVLEIVKDSLYRKDQIVNVNPKLINIKNGLLDVETFELLPHTPELIYTYQINANYNPSATCPNFEQFLKEILVKEDTLEPDYQLIRLIQQFMGYCLYLKIPFHECVMFYGSGRNGKSTLVFVVSELFKKLTSQVHFEDIGEDRFATSDMAGKLVNISAEFSANAKLSDGHIKGIISGDEQRAQRKHQPAFDFRPFAKHIITTNNLPRSKDKSLGFFSRFMIIPFHRIFLKEKEIKTLSADEPKDNYAVRDAYLEEKLKNELDGILIWTIYGLKDLLKSGGFCHSDQVQKFREIFKVRCASVESFMDEKVDTSDSSKKVEFQALYRAYISYCKEYKIPPETNKGFSPLLRNLGYEIDAGGKNIKYVLGVVLK